MRIGIRDLRIITLASLVAAALCLSLSKAPRAEAATISLQQIGPAFSGPVGIVNAGDGTDRLFIVEQAGRIRVMSSAGVVYPTPFLDISALLPNPRGFEEGLLGLAFHPDYENNGFFYVYYNDTASNIRIVRYSQSNGDINQADPTSDELILTINHPGQTNHNGGQLNFGPDGYLYAGVGDGGGAGDPNNNAQNVNTLLGKMLRLDVDGGTPYAIPAGNPYAGATPGLDEIWAIGLRNPWRFSFDRLTADMFIGDVGQNVKDEVNFQAAAEGGDNYGWRIMEGTSCYNPPSGCNQAGLTLPILEHNLSNGNCALIGGYRYRGAQSALAGRYVYGDYCSGRIWTATVAGSTWTAAEALDTTANITTFGEDEDGELYVADGNAIYKINALDSDGDSVPDAADNCVSVPNPLQENADANLIDLSPPKAFDDTTLANSDGNGDHCDSDDDNDGRTDADEASGAGCAGQATSRTLRDTDGDRLLDGAECALGLNPNAINAAPAVCNAAGDADGDNVPDARENCYYNTSGSTNADGDNCGDAREIASINGDTSVNVIDLQQIAMSPGAYSSPGPAHLVNFDVTKNGSIDVLDLQFVAARNGPCP